MASSQQKTALAFSAHNHHQCEQSLLDTARRLCQQRSVKLTRRRQQVLQILLATHQPLGAYDILQSLNQREKSITPPIVYRALDFLQQQGLVHRIESKNAFIPCMRPGHDCDAQFLICSKCQRVAELDNPVSGVIDDAERVGFTVDHAVIEINGLCADCRR